MERPHPAFEKAEPDELDLQIERRREIYQQELYCKVCVVFHPSQTACTYSLWLISQHIGSSPQTRYRPNPTPHEIANSPQLVQRATAFLRRELRVWTHTDVEYLTSHILSLIKAVDVRSDVAVRLLAEYLDPPAQPHSHPHPPASASASHAQSGLRNGAEHFAHELYSWLRSPYKELRQWDLVAQVGRVIGLGAEGSTRQMCRTPRLNMTIMRQSYQRRGPRLDRPQDRLHSHPILPTHLGLDHHTLLALDHGRGLGHGHARLLHRREIPPVATSLSLLDRQERGYGTSQIHGWIQSMLTGWMMSGVGQKSG